MYKHQNITELIIKAFYNVYNKLGYGFLEKVYENAMVIELKKLDLEVCKQHPILVFYDEIEVGRFCADIPVENSVLVELKAAETICPDHEAQLTNYLRSTEIEVGLLLNFSKTAQIKRKIFDNSFKQTLNMIKTRSV